MKVLVKIEGTTDYLQNKYVISEEEASGVKRKKATGEGGTSVEDKTYINKKGCFIPAKQILKALEEASGKFIKKGKQTWKEDFKAGTLIDEQEISFNPAKKSCDTVHVIDGRVPPRTGGRIVIKRPQFNTGWKASFTMEVDDDIPFAVLKDAFDVAGSKKGIGDWRPQFGRFKVIQINKA